MARICTHCGTSIPDGIGFCGQCGASQPVSSAEPATATAVPGKRALGTMIGIAAVDLSPPPPTAAPAPHNARAMGTMIGMPAVDLPSPQQPPQPPVGQAIAPPPDDKRTLLGVAIPGIAPSQPPVAARSAQGDMRTMLGVAIPGVAPMHASEPPLPRSSLEQPSTRPRPMAALPPIVPAPPPLQLDALPAPMQHAQKRGFPLAIVAGVVGAVVVIAGIAIAFLWKGASPVLVQPRLGPQGDDELHLSCESCPDGTIVAVGGAKAQFAKGQTDVKLTAPLHTGENPLDLSLDRPGVGRDEIVHAVVPISFRIRTDISTLDSDTPAIVVRVEAAAGSMVNVDGASVPLDAQGKGVHSVDVTSDLSGAADEGKQLEKNIPYDVTMKDASGKLGTERGTVTASAPIPPLRVDAPTAHATIDKSSFFLAGRTIPKGATITASGRALPVGDNGFFGDTFTTSDAETKITVRASVANMAPRIIELDVRHVDNLANEAKAFEARTPLGYDDAVANTDADIGKEIALAGETLESRVQNHQTVFVLDDKRGCAHGPCITRVIYGAEIVIHPHDPIRAYGRVSGAAHDKDGKSVPEVEADFILRGAK